MQHTAFIPSTLDCAKLTALLAKHKAWQVCYVHNNHQPIIGILPQVSWRLDARQGHIVLTKQIRGQKVQQLAGSYSDLLQQLIDYSQEFTNLQPRLATQQGFMGFIGYDIAAHALNPTIGIDQEQPACFFGHYDIRLTPCPDGFLLTYEDVNNEHGLDFESLVAQLITIAQQKPMPPKPLPFVAVWSKDDYWAAFEKSQAYLLAGDGYQINLTQAWQAQGKHQLHDHLPKLMSISQADFGGFLGLADFELLSLSPELFFTFEKKGQTHQITTKPIKGTRPRSNDQASDQALKDALASSEKDIAENLMIVDLLRNDLGKYAQTGQVKTPKRFAIESFYNVHHMVSTITATLKPEVHPLTVLFGSLPAGSITGAPKKRACEMIHELEAMPRGAYCGTMGVMNFDGSGQFNVLIRTLQANQKATQLWAGGGITICSVYQDEYQECLDKVGAILAITAAS